MVVAFLCLFFKKGKLITNKKKLKELQKIIDKYIKILKVLPTGGEISEEEAKRIGIPKELKSYIDRAYKSGKLKAYTRVRISVKETKCCIR